MEQLVYSCSEYKFYLLNLETSSVDRSILVGGERTFRGVQDYSFCFTDSNQNYGVFYFLGGIRIRKKTFNSEVIEVNPILGTRSHLPKMTQLRRSAGAVVFGDFLYSIGGAYSNDLTCCERLNLHTKSEWETVEPLNVPRSNFAVAADQNYIYVAGGGNKLGFLSTCERFDGTNWVVLPLKLPVAEKYIAGVSVGDSLIILGGRVALCLSLVDYSVKEVGQPPKCKVSHPLVTLESAESVKVFVVEGTEVLEYEVQQNTWERRKHFAKLKTTLRPFNLY